MMDGRVLYFCIRVPNYIFHRFDCSSSTQGSLVCYKRGATESVPGCSGGGVSGDDYCCDRPPNYLFDIGNNKPAGSYGLCEGDCDIDDDCKDNLICEQRDEYEEVPGCDGTGRRRTDYCRDPDPSTTAPTPKTTNPKKSPSSQPTKVSLILDSV